MVRYFQLLGAAFSLAALSACGGSAGGLALSPHAPAALRTSSGFQVLYNFQGGPSDGAGPDGILETSSGTFLGTAYSGGHIHPRDCKTTGCGTIFEFDGSVSHPVYLFEPQPSGFHPVGGLLQRDGAYYGVAAGGVRDDGIVFSLTRATNGNWVVTTLYSFTGAPHDGFEPSGLFYIGDDGTIFGATRMGGDGTGCLFSTSGCGTIFKLKPPATTSGAWEETILHSFEGGDGAGPGGSVVRIDGSFYGTTEFGGASGLCPAVLGCGTIYKITPTGSGAIERVVHSFYTESTSKDGVWADGLVDGGDGRLYGATQFGGGVATCEVEPQVYGCGTVFSLAIGNGKKPKVTTLHAFAGGTDGEATGALAGGTSTGVYGYTQYGGLTAACFDGCGTIFHVTRSGKTWVETKLHVFNRSDGEGPAGPLLLIASKLYGTATAGGTAACSCGTLFEQNI